MAANHLMSKDRITLQIREIVRDRTSDLNKFFNDIGTTLVSDANPIWVIDWIEVHYGPHIVRRLLIMYSKFIVFKILHKF